MSRVSQDEPGRRFVALQDGITVPKARWAQPLTKRARTHAGLYACAYQQIAAAELGRGFLTRLSALGVDTRLADASRSCVSVYVIRPRSLITTEARPVAMSARLLFLRSRCSPHPLSRPGARALPILRNSRQCLSESVTPLSRPWIAQGGLACFPRADLRFGHRVLAPWSPQSITRLVVKEREIEALQGALPG